MTATEILKYLHEEIHTMVVVTVDDNGLPVTCAIDMMDADEEGLYFPSRQKARAFITG